MTINTSNNQASMETSDDETSPVIYAPPSRQHITAGPYSPVLIISPEQLVVICGQAAVDLDGNLVSEDFEEQTRVTLENCKRQLAAADCEMSNVFKVNVYLTNLADWPDFNRIYREYFTEPLPVRTAVQCGLLNQFQVEVELWAARKSSKD